jgi:hypothetical protein
MFNDTNLIFLNFLPNTKRWAKFQCRCGRVCKERFFDFVSRRKMSCGCLRRQRHFRPVVDEMPVRVAPSYVVTTPVAIATVDVPPSDGVNPVIIAPVKPIVILLC